MKRLIFTFEVLERMILARGASVPPSTHDSSGDEEEKELPNELTATHWGLFGALIVACLLSIYVAYRTFRRIHYRRQQKRRKQAAQPAIQRTVDLSTDTESNKSLQLPSDYDAPSKHQKSTMISHSDRKKKASTKAGRQPKTNNSSIEDLSVYSQRLEEVVTQSLPPTTLSAYMTQFSLHQFQAPQTLATLTNEEKELSLPGYLEMEVEKDLLIQGVIGAGGFSKIFAASIQNPKLAERAGSSVCVLKVLDGNVFKAKSWQLLI